MFASEHFIDSQVFLLTVPDLSFARARFTFGGQPAGPSGPSVGDARPPAGDRVIH